MHIIGTDTGNGVWLIAVHINQCLEAVLLAAVKQPVNRTFLVNFTMVCIEIVEEVIANHILRLTFSAQCIGNEFQVFIQYLCTVDCFHKLYEQTDNIILEIFIVTNRDDVILVGGERRILAGIPFATCVGNPICIERVSTEHTTNSVGNKRANIPCQLCLADGHVFILNIWCQLVL